MNYQPKGSQCVNCKHKHKDCSKLEFHKMRAHSVYGNLTIVLCNKFVSDKK